MSAWLTHPQWLWLLALLPLLAAWDLRRTWSEPTRLRWARVGVRCLLLALIAIALSGPRWREPAHIADVVFVVDTSASVPDVQLLGALSRVEALRTELGTDVRTGLVLFDTTPEVAVFPGDPWSLPVPLRESPAGEGTDIAAALRLAAGLVPPDGAGQLVLLTDGRPTSGDVRRAASRAATRDLTVSVVPLTPGANDPALVAITLVEDEVAAGARLEGTVTVDGGTGKASGTVVVLLDGEVIHEEEVSADAPGTVDVAFSHDLPAERTAGLLPIDATFRADGDDDPSDNHGGATLVVSPPPRVWVVTGPREDVTPFKELLEAEGMRVEVTEVSRVTEDHSLDDVDLLVLANAPILDEDKVTPMVPEGFSDEVRRYVSDGGGLLVLGGDRSYDLGGYGETELRHVLPVEFDNREPAVQQTVTLIIILDRSGSMGAWAGDKTKMELADEGAAASMRMLRPIDKLGVMSVDDRVHWEIPVQPVTHKDNMERRILSVYAMGGGIYTYTSLIAAQDALEDDDSPLKHVILFTDAADTEEVVKDVIFGWGPGPNIYDVAREMRADHITLSVIGIGTKTDAHTGYITSLANAGGGKFYLTNDATELRSLFIEETKRFVDSQLSESAFRVRRSRRHAMVEGIDFAAAPDLSGYIEVEARDTAEVILTGPNKDPILVTWQYGLGQVTTFSSDAGPRWAASWVGWKGYDQLWTQVARASLRRDEGRQTALEVDFDGDDAIIRVARRASDGMSREEGMLHTQLVELDEKGLIGSSSVVPLRAIEPGLWEGRVPAERSTAYRASVLSGKGLLLAEHTFARPPSEELLHRTADEDLLGEIARSTGGEIEPQALPAVVRRAGMGEATPLGLWFLIASLLLLPVDAWARRPAR